MVADCSDPEITPRGMPILTMGLGHMLREGARAATPGPLPAPPR